MISTKIKDLKDKVNQDRAKEQVLTKQLNSELKKYDKKESELNNSIKARSLIQEVANDTQKNLEYHISNIVTTALQSIFPDPYNFTIEFVSKRNKTECNIWFEKDDEYFDPMFSSGGGVLDITSFALRASYRNLEGSRPVLIMDEPMKFLSADLRVHAAETMRRISESLGIQIIMVTNLEELLDSGDKVFKVNQGVIDG